jgi:hypothetical protein
MNTTLKNPTDKTTWAKYRCIRCGQLHWHETADDVNLENVYERICDYCRGPRPTVSEQARGEGSRAQLQVTPEGGPGAHYGPPGETKAVGAGETVHRAVMAL